MYAGTVFIRKGHTMQLISYDRSIIPACDVPSLTHLARIADGTTHMPGVGAYKIGLDLVIRFGLAQAIRIVRGYSPTAPDHL